MQGCGYQLAVCRAITHGLMPAVAHSCKVGYGGGLYNSIRTSSHPEDGEKTPASYLSRKAQRVVMHMSPIMVPYQGTNTMCPPSGTTAYWAYEACVHAHGIRKYDLGYRHTIRMKSSPRNAVVSGLPYLPI